ncbi:hypothetical protein [Methylovirgula sp. HY1]|uniref:hypothetical protein n=1 Tax=Methylovirgula sp. HY1 TaxID=2822761 RepID=UPI001C5A65D6|nr:hypothetical protein [Methylovirgula sp. HY1]QXX76416.1 hypothetical protein MHY1_03256 [Methylovirgula sp. HY1]
MNPLPSALPHGSRNLFSAYSFDTLISGAARLRPQALALRDGGTSVPFGLLAGQATALVRLLTDCGLRPGERILLTGGAEASLVIAIVAALRGGFEAALAPLDLEAGELAAFARAINAAALAGPMAYGALSPAETYFAAAAAAPSIRLLATLGPQEIDGAVDLSTAATLRYAAAHPDLGVDLVRPASAEPPPIITFDRIRRKPVFHRQTTLMAAGLDFVARATIGRETPILSTLPPVTFAGLVAGPLAALLSGAALYLDGPFDAENFLKRRDEAGHAHLIIPAAIATEFAGAGIFDGLASAVLLSRHSAGAAFAVPTAFDSPCPLIDLYAIDETAAIAEPRRAGMVSPPAVEPHFIGFDDDRVLTVEACSEAGRPLACRGAAVTSEV